jgi:hypothetical protein
VEALVHERLPLPVAFLPHAPRSHTTSPACRTGLFRQDNAFEILILSKDDLMYCIRTALESWEYF